jgi:hypothetical protein
MTTRKPGAAPTRRGAAGPLPQRGAREIAAPDLAGAPPPLPTEVMAPRSGGDLIEARVGDPVQEPTGRDVLGFLDRLRLDPRRVRNLNSGRNLLLEAAKAGLIEPRETDGFSACLVALRRAGLADWTCARNDVRGDDLAHAAEFHVTARGRNRLAATARLPG